VYPDDEPFAALRTSLMFRKIAKKVMPFHGYIRKVEKDLIDIGFAENSIERSDLFSDENKFLHRGAWRIDIGCGDKSVRFKNTIGLDVDRRLRPDIVCDVAKMPIRDNCISAIASNSVLEHVTSLHEMVQEVRRVSKSGCRMEFTIGSDRDDEYPEFFKKISAVVYGTKNNFSMEEWSAIFQSNGIDVVRKVRYVPKAWHFLYLLSCMFPPAAVWSKAAERIRDEKFGVFMECVKT